MASASTKWQKQTTVLPTFSYHVLKAAFHNTGLSAAIQACVVSLNSCTDGLMEWQNHTWSENGLWGFIFCTSPFESLPESDSGILMYVFLPCNTMAGTIRVHTSRQKTDSHLHKNITNLKLQTESLIRPVMHNPVTAQHNPYIGQTITLC